jgi:hypothetical protein
LIPRIRFNRPSQFVGLPLLLRQIGFHLLMTEIITDDGMDIRQLERWEIVRDLFRRCSTLLVVHNTIERNTSRAHAQNAFLVSSKRYWLAGNNKSHLRSPVL